MNAACTGPPSCEACTGMPRRPCLVLEWMAFLDGIERLAEQEAKAMGQIYHRCSEERLREIAMQAASRGIHPRATTARPLPRK